jgi:hypothetical protein
MKGTGKTAIDGQVSVEVRMQRWAQSLKQQLPGGWGFILFAFPFGSEGQMNYVSNAQRADVVAALREFIEATKDSYGDRDPSDDTELGRLRQRCTQLEEMLYTFSGVRLPE